MSAIPDHPLTVRGTSVAVDGRAVLIVGRSGAGKSDLAVRLIDRGARLISDDYTLISAVEGRLRASAPDAIAGKIELRGVGLLALPAQRDVPVCLMADLDASPERMPEPQTRLVAGLPLPAVALVGLEPSAPIKLEAALAMFGLPAQ